MQRENGTRKSGVGMNFMTHDYGAASVHCIDKFILKIINAQTEKCAAALLAAPFS